MDVRDICPYPCGTSAHRLLSKKEIHSILTIKENKKNWEIHRHSRENACNFVDLAGFEPAISSVRWIKMQGKIGKKASTASNIAQKHHAVSAY